VRRVAISRAELRQARIVATAAKRARSKAEVLHKRRAAEWTLRRYSLFLKAMSITWTTPRTTATLDLGRDALALARQSVTAKQECRLARIDRAEAAMRMGAYVRPSRMRGQKLVQGA
jgi:hypothetical protein